VRPLVRSCPRPQTGFRAVLAQRLPQDPLLRLVASAQPQPRRPCPPAAAARPTRSTPNRSGVPASLRSKRSAAPLQPPISRTAGLPALSTRPSHPHSPAHAEKPDGTVTHPAQRHFPRHQPRARRAPQARLDPPPPAVSSRHRHPRSPAHARFSLHCHFAPVTATSQSSRATDIPAALLNRLKIP
jgi:hypothetical protein